MDTEVTYTYDRALGGYLIGFPDVGAPREIYKMFFELYNTVFKGKRIFSEGHPEIYSRHCKFHKRLGSRIIYEFIITKR